MKVKFSDQALFKELDAGVLALNLQTGKYYLLNSVGRQMWMLLAEENSLDEVRDVIISEYDAPPERVDKDLMALLTGLKTAGLLAKA
jgi:hypothetical protein